jgi:hypothetical protein
MEMVAKGAACAEVQADTMSMEINAGQMAHFNFRTGVRLIGESPISMPVRVHLTRPGNYATNRPDLYVARKLSKPPRRQEKRSHSHILGGLAVLFPPLQRHDFS